MSLKSLNKEVLKCNILQNEYKILSKIICKMENIIITNENVLLFSKNQSMKSLNELIKKLNETYNDSIIDILSVDLNSVQNESMYSEIQDLRSENSIGEDSNSTCSSSTNDNLNEKTNIKPLTKMELNHKSSKSLKTIKYEKKANTIKL